MNSNEQARYQKFEEERRRKQKMIDSINKNGKDYKKEVAKTNKIMEETGLSRDRCVGPLERLKSAHLMTYQESLTIRPYDSESDLEEDF